MTSAEIATTPTAALERLDPAARELAVTQYLTDARDRLASALEATGPAAVAAIKAEIATAAEATKQLGLSKEIQTDAVEMVRRAEFALGKAIRAGQERGEVRTPGQRAVGPRTDIRSGRPVEIAGYETANASASSPESFGMGSDELSRQVYPLVDGVTEPEFEAAITEARNEGNLSRANVIRKIRCEKTDDLTPLDRLRKLRELAPRGYTSGQIATEVGVTESHIRELARENRIEITADKVLNRTHRIRVDSNHIVGHAVMTLEALVAGFDRIDVDDLDEAQTQNWTDSLTQSIRALNRLNKQIKETIQ